MLNKKHLILSLLAVILMVVSTGLISAHEYSNLTDDLSFNSNFNEDLVKIDDSDFSNNLSVSENESCEVLSANINSDENVLSASSQGHTYHIDGYTFTVSSSQYAKIKNAIKMGKQKDWLDNGFTFKVKTNKVKKVKVLVKTKTYKKKVKYEAFKPYTYNVVKLANLNKYYKKGWKKYSQGYKSYKNQKKYLGYNYVVLKKTVKKYKKVKMRVYAKVTYQGWSKYNGGPHYYYPWVDFNAMKSGYKTRYLGMAEFV